MTRIIACLLVLLAGACSDSAAEVSRAGAADVAPTGEPSAVPMPKDKASPADDVKALDAETRRIAAAACAEQEEVIFHCTMKSGKVLSVCATKDGVGEYRYGGVTPELVLQGGSWSRTTYSGGGESQLLFANGDTNYIVFSRMIRTNFAPDEPNDPAISDGVVIERKNKFAAIMLCDGGQADIPVQYDAAERVLGEMDDLYTGDTIRADSM